ncbi:HNH endonuclease [Methylorubrum populi]
MIRCDAPDFEDVGTTRRKPLTPSQKLELYEAQGGICPLCTLPMRPGKRLIDEHLRSLGLGGTNDFGNRAIVHEACAQAKTHGPEGDLARIADAKSQKRSILGFEKPRRPMPGSKASGLKRGFDGQVTRR